jgi:hypothetical protein
METNLRININTKIYIRQNWKRSKIKNILDKPKFEKSHEI